ncbi:DUF1302 domain-containing protein [Marinobacter bohaiensis]|uniref:DUF1302 domain-containing protein n=1 Tax=Marinobacter bohaiensis TaxID=2201898 RepID=UPI00195515CB|nr:DUF1302 family protein [Marinobacter bohaiensis]
MTSDKKTLPQQVGNRYACAFIAATMMAGTPAYAIGDFGKPRINWTNNLQYNLLYRLQDPNSALLANQPGNKYSANVDDGNASFDKGVVSNRLELLSELDVIFQNGWGARVSGLAWYDTVYNERNDNPGFAGGAVPNQTSVPYNEFTDDTRDLQGRDIELRDAFVFGRTTVGDAALRFRAGQYASVWGESLFFANNSIAGAQNAFDIDRLLRDPTAEAKEFVLPVPQVGADLQLTSDLTFSAYYQFGYEPNRLPGVGSYFSSQDQGVVGAENMWIGPGQSIPRSGTDEPDDSGQFGFKVRWRLGYTDLGFYALRFHDKSYQQVVRLGLQQVGPNPGDVAAVPEDYYLTYNEGTTAYGVSVSHSFGSVNVAGEASIRHNQALASTGAADTSSFTSAPASDNHDHPAYAVGDTAHINLSTIWSLEPGLLWQEATFLGEVAWNRRLNCHENCDVALDPNATRDAVAFRAVFEPVYRQVITGLDLGVPVGVGYSPKGSRSSLGAGFPAENGGDVTLGLNGTYLNSWQISLAYTHFYGRDEAFLVERENDANNPAFSYQQSLKDRDFASLTASRRF